jgi:hypothetical protein
LDLHLVAALPAGTPVEVGAGINVPGIRLLAAPLGATAADVKGGLGWGELLGEEAAVGTETVTLLLEVGSLELNAATLGHAEQTQDSAEDTVLAVGSVLGPKSWNVSNVPDMS